MLGVGMIFMGIYSIVLNKSHVALMDSKAVSQFVLGTMIDENTYHMSIYLRSCLFLAAGGLTFSYSKFAPPLYLLCLLATAIFVAYPFQELEFDRAMSWILLVKIVVSMGAAALLLLTNGKIVSEDA